MTETEAEAWLECRVSRETIDGFHHLKRLVVADQQNLVAASTIANFLTRHVVDSVQLVQFAPAGNWIDIGSGAGFPGIPVAMVRDDDMTLVEPRALRAEFLNRAKDVLALRNVSILPTSVAAITSAPAAVISARAVAPLTKLFAMAAHLADERTRWILPKGRNAMSEVETARQSWHARFQLVPSCTAEDAMIVIADEVRPRKGSR